MTKYIGFYDDVTHVATEVATAANGFVTTDSSGAPQVPQVLSGAHDDTGAAPTSTMTAGWAITSNYGGFGEVDYWSTVNADGSGDQGFYWHQKTGASTQILIGNLFTDGSTYSEFDLINGSNRGFIYVDGTQYSFGSTNAIPFQFYVNNVKALEIDTSQHITTGDWRATKIGLAYGGTNADLSATGGASQVLKQTSIGAAVTVAQLTYADIASGSTGATATGLTVSGGTLSGTTTLPGSGQITSSGELSVLGSALSAISVAGDYTSSNSALFSLGGNFTSSAAGTLVVSRQDVTVTPSGSATEIRGGQFKTTVGTTSINFSSVMGTYYTIVVGAGYSGTITNLFGFVMDNPTISAGTVTNVAQQSIVALTANNGASSGTKTHRQILLNGITSGAAGATVNNRALEIVVPSGGASSGTANNRGLFISGNGGTASGGTVNNFAIVSTSTAASALAGGLSVGSASVPTGNVALDIHSVALLNGITFTNVPGTPTAGMMCYVTDSTTAVWGATITGGGANKVLAWYNGANWTVFGA